MQNDPAPAAVNYSDPRHGWIAQAATLECNAFLLLDTACRGSLSHGNASTLFVYDGAHLRPVYGWGRLPREAMRQAARAIRARWTATHAPGRDLIARQ